MLWNTPTPTLRGSDQRCKGRRSEGGKRYLEGQGNLLLSTAGVEDLVGVVGAEVEGLDVGVVGREMEGGGAEGLEEDDDEEGLVLDF